MKASILEDFKIESKEIQESDVDKIISCLKEIEQANPHRQEKIYPETINVLLLGQTGCGKSTFINAFKNYMKHCDVYRLGFERFAFFQVNNYSTAHCEIIFAVINLQFAVK